MKIHFSAFLLLNDCFEIEALINLNSYAERSMAFALLQPALIYN